MKEQKISHALEECLTLLEREEATLDECLARYPRHAAELRPLLTIAQEMRHVSLPSPSPAATARWRRRAVDALAAQKPSRPTAEPLSRRLARVGLHFQAVLQRVPRAATLVGLSALLLAVGLGLYLLVGTPTVQAATLTDVQGTVEMLSAGSGTWLPLSAGQQVMAGDRIRVGQSSIATLTFPNGSTTDLESGTDVDLLQIKARWYSQDSWDVVLHQRAGRTTNCLRCPASAAYRFEVRTQIATIVAHSTRFSVSVAEDGATDVAVAEGTVAVTALQTTLWLEAGQMTSVRPEEPLAPILPIPISTQEPTSTPVPTLEADEIEIPEPTESPASIEIEDEEKHETSEPIEVDEDDDHEERETPEPTEVDEDGDHEERETPKPTEADEDDDHEEHETPKPTEVDEDDDHEEHETPEPTKTPTSTKTEEHDEHHASTPTPEPDAEVAD